MIKKYDIKNQNIEVNTFVFQIAIFHHVQYKFILNRNIYQNDQKFHCVKYSSSSVEKWKIATENMLIGHIKQVINYLNNDLDLKKLKLEWAKEINVNFKKYLNWIVDNLK